jgi:hypothetical protein
VISLRREIRSTAVLALCSLCSLQGALADCYLGRPAVVETAAQVTDQINTLNDLAARDIAQSSGPVCANSFTNDPEIWRKFSGLLNCSGPDADAKTLHDRLAPNRALARMFLSAAINKGLCVDALNFRIEFLRRISVSASRIRATASESPRWNLS